ncbi:araM domain protein [Wolbachia endosymbiont of Brugia pahangi]|nr:araM domain protein [Wolbachia endosymbiont of Brugia pahangi]
MHYLKQILHQTKQTSIVIVGHHFVDNIYEICTQYENDIFLVVDKNTAELLIKTYSIKLPT